MTSWFVAYSNPTLSSIKPSWGPYTGATEIDMTGTGFMNTVGLFTVHVSGADSVLAQVINATHLSFSMPPLSQPGPVTLTISPNAQQVVPNQSLTFNTYTPPTITSLDPDRGQTVGEEYNITVTGTNFVDTGIVKCRFGSIIKTDGWFVSSTTVICRSPQMSSAQIVPVEVSLNDQQYTSSGVKFTFVEYFSDQCRFKDELTIFESDRVELDLDYFPNLAILPGVTVTATPRSSKYSDVVSPDQITDGDRCCKYSSVTLGQKCGVIFAKDSSLPTVIVDLQDDAYVDEVLSSWYEPCKNLPHPGYDVSYRKSPSDPWTHLLTRVTWEKNPCRTVPGDAGATAFCADFFKPIEGRQFMWTFNNSRGDGGWLLEVEIHGILLRSPHSIQCPAPMTVVSAPVVTLPAFDVLLHNIKFANTDAYNETSVSISVLGKKQDVHLLNSAAVSTMTISNPKTGTYDMKMQASGLIPCNTTLTVTHGTPYRLSSTFTSSKPSSHVTSVGTIEVIVLDQVNNTCVDAGRIVTISVTAGQLHGNTTVMSSGGMAVFSDLALIGPSKGSYVLVAESPGLVGCQVSVDVTVGVAVQLAGDSTGVSWTESDDVVSLSPPSIHVKDAGANIVKNDAGRSITARLLNTSFEILGNNTVPTSQGMAVFKDLKLGNPPAGRYLFVFSSPGLTSFVWHLDIAVGQAKSLGIASRGPTEVRGDCHLTLEPITINARDAGQDVVPDASMNVTARCTLLERDVTVPMANGLATFNTLTLNNAIHGDYQLTFSASGMKNAVLSFHIVAGDARTVKALVSSPIVVRCLDQTKVNSFDIAAVDCLGTEIKDDEVNRTVTVDTPLLSSPVIAPMIHGRATIDRLLMGSPEIGLYDLNITATGLYASDQTVQIQVISGPPSSLRVLTIPSFSNNVDPIGNIYVELFDAGGNNVEGNVTLLVSWESRQVVLTSVSSRFHTDTLVIKGDRGSTVPILFTVQDVTTNASVTIESCIDGTVPNPVDRTVCACDRGWFDSAGQCVQCPTGEYKNTVGNGKCIPCATNMETMRGATSVGDCKCRAGLYLDPAGACQSCDPNADCLAGVMKPNEGYWRKDTQVTSKILECRFKDACDGGFNSTCQANYTNPLCSVCEPGYAKQGDQCLLCGEPVWDYLVLVVVIITLFFALRFYVRKQMLGGRSPETTILKVIVSYMQVIAFVGEFKERWPAATKTMFSTIGAFGNAAIFGLQPVDCVFDHAGAYEWLLFFCMLIPASFIVPWILYHLSKTTAYQYVTQLGRMKRDSMSLRAQRGIGTYLEVIRRRSTVHDDRLHSVTKLDIILWPFRLILFHVIPSIPAATGRAWSRCCYPIKRSARRIYNRLAGDGLEQGEVDDDVRQRRMSSTIDPIIAMEARERAKSVGAVLFESDPMIGRSPTSASKGAFWILFFLFLPTIVKHALEMFKDRDDVALEPRLDRDMRVSTNTAMYTNVTFAIIAVLLPVVLALLGYVIFKNAVLRKRRELVRYLAVFNLCWVDSMGYLRLPPGVDAGTAKLLRAERRLLRRLRKYLFLFSGYRTDGVLYLWDLVIMGRKICIAAILVFARNDPMTQTVLGLVVFVTALLLHLVFQPFDNDYARDKKMRVMPSTLELISILATIGTLLAVAYSSGREVPLWLAAIVIIINGGPLLLFIYLLFDAVLHKVASRIGRGVTHQLHTEQAHSAACWWKSKMPWFGWGMNVTRDVLEDDEEERVELEEPLLPTE